jgi:type I restriction enzyme S subunit
VSGAKHTDRAVALRRFKPYPTYKDSGVEWLWEIPAHWEVYALRRRLFREAGSIKIGPFGSALKLEFMTQEGFKVYGQEHVITRDFSRGNKYVDQAKFAELAACEIRPRDIVVTMMGSSGRCAVVPEDIERGIMDSHLLRIRLPDTELDPRFLALLIDEADYVRDQIGAAGKGAIMHGLNSSIIKSVLLAAPPTTEQVEILAFLDREMTRIDALVAKKEQLIELLQEQRAALITRAVTKGLDPDVPMKDSGVEWLGEIPAHWNVNRTKFAARLRSGHTPSRQHPEYWQDCTIPWFGLADVWQIRDGQVEYVYETTEKISQLGLANSAARLLPKGTVILSRTASVGFSAILGVDMATTQDFVNWVCGPTLRPEYLLYVFRSMAHEFRRLTMGSTHQTIYMPDVGAFSTPIPPVLEQDQIVAFVQEERAKIDTLVAKVRGAIERLKELRTALISAAVTGKIDVREEAA